MITEDPTLFLADFGVSVTAGAVSGTGILDMPGEAILDGMVISTDYRVRCEASKFGALSYGQPLEVAGVLYTVREVRLVDDGTFCDVTLERSTDDSATLILDGDWK
jgi:hypothetical protein